jgi:NTE family protein
MMVISKQSRPRRIAIACQGGGSHTAFTAGVLKRLFQEQDKDFEIVALSGTSGGAICALLAWYGLLLHDLEQSIAGLDGFWRDIAANTVWDQYLNTSLVSLSRFQSIVPVPEISPYLYPPWSQEYVKSILQKYVPFDRLNDDITDSSPIFLVGAVNVLTGAFKVFDSRKREIEVEAILASAATPNLFRAVQIGSEIFWDGLLSQNPPIRDLPDAKPDEIWLIQVDPPKRQEEPKTTEDIRDRHNELTANLSLEQEVYFIEKINQLLRNNILQNSPYIPIQIRRILLLRDLDYPSKLDRSPFFIQGLISYGEAQAEKFLRDRAQHPIPA